MCRSGIVGIARRDGKETHTMSENRKYDHRLAEALKGIYDSLTDEQKEKAKACKTMERMWCKVCLSVILAAAS